MKAIVQRVTQASVTVNGELVSSIGKGLCVLLGISRNDTHKETEWMVRKILNLRLFGDENGERWKKSLSDINGEILCVSQFTLQCILKGNKPDFHEAMAAEDSKKFYLEFLEHLRKAYRPDAVKDGQFGAHMQVHIQNDGPVTIDLERLPSSKDIKKKEKNVKGKVKSKEDEQKDQTSCQSDQQEHTEAATASVNNLNLND